MSLFHRLKVARVERETDEASSFTFDIPEALRDQFAPQPGQHINLRLMIDGQEFRRSYSVSSSWSGALRITVKRIKGGVVSNYLNDRLKAQDEIEVMAPTGSFVLFPYDTAHRSHYFFAAGSGITPIFSMLSAVLQAEPHSDCFLLYGNRTQKTVIFKETLDRWYQEYGARFHLKHCLTSPSWWSSFDGHKGRIDSQLVQSWIGENPPVAQDAQYWICGPGGFRQTVIQSLQGIDVPGYRIHQESFGTDPTELDDSVQGQAARLTVHLGEDNAATEPAQAQEVQVQEGQTLLSAMLEAGWDAPYSCSAGVCASCRARLTSGSVHMRARMALDDQEIADGAVLTCQAVPTSDEVSLRYGS